MKSLFVTFVFVAFYYTNLYVTCVESFSNRQTLLLMNANHSNPLVHHSHGEYKQVHPSNLTSSLITNETAHKPHGLRRKKKKKKKNRAKKRKATDEYKLVRKLFRHGSYDKETRPVLHDDDPVVIHMSITIRQIFDLFEKNQTLSIDTWANYRWRDEYIHWNPVDFNNLTVMRVVSSELWLPDIVLYNNAADFAHKRDFFPRALVSYNGDVSWSVRSKYSSSCQIDVTYFPFDQQICRLKFGSWTYNGFQIDLTNASGEVHLGFYVPHGQWDLIKVDQKRNVVTYSCCIEPYPDVTFSLILRRKGLYYLFDIFIPCFVMSGLTVFVFLMPAEDGEKYTLGVTLMLDFVMLMLKIVQTLPESSDAFPLISIYLTAVMSTITMTICISVFVLALNYRSSNSPAVPPVLLRQVNRWAPYFNVHNEPRIPGSKLVKSKIVQFISQMAGEEDSKTTLARLILQRLGLGIGRKSEATAERQAQIIVHGLRRIIDRELEIESENKRNSDWRRLAQLLDRILFWLILLIMIVYTIVLLVMVPMMRLRGE